MKILVIEFNNSKYPSNKLVDDNYDINKVLSLLNSTDEFIKIEGEVIRKRNIKKIFLRNQTTVEHDEMKYEKNKQENPQYTLSTDFFTDSILFDPKPKGKWNDPMFQNELKQWCIRMYNSKMIPNDELKSIIDSNFQCFKSYELVKYFPDIYDSTFDKITGFLGLF